MLILHVIQSIDKSIGGPARSVTSLLKVITLNKKISIKLIAKNSANPIMSELNGKPETILFTKNRTELKSLLKSYSASNLQLMHGQGIWQYNIHKMASIARKNKIPYIITTRGMLEPWSLSQKKLKKALALFLYQKKDLDNARVIQATCQSEHDNLRKLGFKNPIAVIPNGIDLTSYPNYYPIKSSKPQKILFLSRIHKKKGIENLIKAWKHIETKRKKNWVVEIVGNGDLKYIKTLSNLIAQYDLQKEIKIFDSISGKEKIRKFRDASIFILPTYSENFGMVIAEALASFTPVITTKGAPWEDLEKYNCGWWIDIGVEPLKTTLEEVLIENITDLKSMGINGRNLIKEKYNIEIIGKKTLRLYQWIINKGETPEFVYFQDFQL